MAELSDNCCTPDAAATIGQTLKLALPECRLPETAVAPQVARYRELAEHVVETERDLGKLRVQFDETVPDGLLTHTIAVERGCCSFVDLSYEPQARSLTFTVADIVQDSRLDTLRALLTPR